MELLRNFIRLAPTVPDLSYAGFKILWVAHGLPSLHLSIDGNAPGAGGDGCGASPNDDSILRQQQRLEGYFHYIIQRIIEYTYEGSINVGTPLRRLTGVVPSDTRFESECCYLIFSLYTLHATQTFQPKISIKIPQHGWMCMDVLLHQFVSKSSTLHAGHALGKMLRDSGVFEWTFELSKSHISEAEEWQLEWERDRIGYEEEEESVKTRESYQVTGIDPALSKNRLEDPAWHRAFSQSMSALTELQKLAYKNLKRTIPDAEKGRLDNLSVKINDVLPIMLVGAKATLYSEEFHAVQRELPFDVQVRAESTMREIKAARRARSTHAISASGPTNGAAPAAASSAAAAAAPSIAAPASSNTPPSVSSPPIRPIDAHRLPSSLFSSVRPYEFHPLPRVPGLNGAPTIPIPRVPPESVIPAVRDATNTLMAPNITRELIPPVEYRREDCDWMPLMRKPIVGPDIEGEEDEKEAMDRQSQLPGEHPLEPNESTSPIPSTIAADTLPVWSHSRDHAFIHALKQLVDRDSEDLKSRIPTTTTPLNADAVPTSPTPPPPSVLDPFYLLSMPVYPRRPLTSLSQDVRPPDPIRVYHHAGEVTRVIDEDRMALIAEEDDIELVYPLRTHTSSPLVMPRDPPTHEEFVAHLDELRRSHELADERQQLLIRSDPIPTHRNNNARRATGANMTERSILQRRQEQDAARRATQAAARAQASGTIATLITPTSDNIKEFKQRARQIVRDATEHTSQSILVGFEQYRYRVKPDDAAAAAAEAEAEAATSDINGDGHGAQRQPTVGEGLQDITSSHFISSSILRTPSHQPLAPPQRDINNIQLAEQERKETEQTSEPTHDEDDAGAAHQKELTPAVEALLPSESTIPKSKRTAAKSRLANKREQVKSQSGASDSNIDPATPVPRATRARKIIVEPELSPDVQDQLNHMKELTDMLNSAKRLAEDDDDDEEEVNNNQTGTKKHATTTTTTKSRATPHTVGSSSSRRPIAHSFDSHSRANDMLSHLGITSGFFTSGGGLSAPATPSSNTLEPISSPSSSVAPISRLPASNFLRPATEPTNARKRKTPAARKSKANDAAAGVESKPQRQPRAKKARDAAGTAAASSTGVSRSTPVVDPAAGSMSVDSSDDFDPFDFSVDDFALDSADEADQQAESDRLANEPSQFNVARATQANRDAATGRKRQTNTHTKRATKGAAPSSSSSSSRSNKKHQLLLSAASAGFRVNPHEFADDVGDIGVFDPDLDAAGLLATAASLQAAIAEAMDEDD